MTQPAGGIAAPRTIDVPIMGATKKLTVRPWSMAQQDELLPLVAGLLDQYTEWQSKPQVFTLGSLVLKFYAEVREICERSVREELVARDLKWDELHGEDLYGIAQAVWETSISRPGGGGVLGKGIALLGPMLGPVLQRAAAQSSGTSPSFTTASGRPRSATSPSTTVDTPISEDLPRRGLRFSPGDGEAAPSGSGTS